MTIEELRNKVRLAGMMKSCMLMSDETDANERERLGKLNRQIIAEAKEHNRSIARKLRYCTNSKRIQTHKAMLREVVVIQARAEGRI